MKRSKHNLGYTRLTTFDGGEIVPIGLTEVLPGDSFRHDTSALVRVQPLVAPVMHPVDVQVHHWFVPNRLVWTGWEDFITGVNTLNTVPIVQITELNTGGVIRLAQGFGAGLDDGGDPFTVSLNAMPFRGYNLIFNEFYRDQDIDSKVTVNTGGGSDLVGNYTMLRSRWAKDYFTTARVEPQAGDGSVVSLGLSGEAPVKGLGFSDTAVYTGTAAGTREAGTVGVPPGNDWSTVALSPKVRGDNASKIPSVYADLGATGFGLAGEMEINEWRRAMAYQRLLEHRNRFGSRYRDYLAFLGVKSSDARLQRPEYLGGGKVTLSFSEVLATAETTEAALGTMGGHGIGAVRSRAYRRFFEEHGYVHSFMIIRPRPMYTQQVPRHFLRRVMTDYWQKELEMMGEQPISNREIYSRAADDSGVFGYIPRYDDYRRAFSNVAGEFRTTLDYWHYGRIFADQPVLNPTFLECLPTDRVYVTTDASEFLVMVQHRIKAFRLIQKFGSH